MISCTAANGIPDSSASPRAMASPSGTCSAIASRSERFNFTGTDGDSGAGTVGNATCAGALNLPENLVRLIHANVSALPALGGRRGGILSLLRHPASGSADPGRHHRWHAAVQEEPAGESRPGGAPLADP